MKIELTKRPGSPYWYFDYTWKGRRIRKSTKTTDKHLAELAKSKLILQLDRESLGLEQGDIKTEITTFHHKIKSYIDNHYPKRTAETYWLRWRNFLRWIATERKYTFIQDISKQDLEDYKTYRLKQTTIHNKTVSRATVNNELKDLRRLFNIALKLELIKFNVFKNISMLRHTKKVPHYYTDDELQRIFSHLTPRYKPYFITLLYTGMRKGELEQLQWADVDLERKLIHIKPHGDRTISKCRPRTIEMHEQVYQAIMERKQLQESDVYIFSSKQGNVLTKNILYTIFQIAKQKAGVKKGNVHSLRHTFATRLVQNHVDLKYISYLLGHTTVKTTEIYAHIKPPDISTGFLEKHLNWDM
ncbi:site-specific integrase [candidate division KSB1 bacterium]|nr:site-specific integrase [candidate division KSB1 bacterium]